jgi:hypothetical protein
MALILTNSKTATVVANSPAPSASSGITKVEPDRVQYKDKAQSDSAFLEAMTNVPTPKNTLHPNLVPAPIVLSGKDFRQHFMETLIIMRLERPDHDFENKIVFGIVKYSINIDTNC